SESFVTGMLKPFADAAVDQQIAGPKARDPAERLRATNALGRCGRRPVCAKAARALEQALFDPSPTVRRGALNALVALDARAAGGAIARLLAVERDASVVPAALLALGALQVQGHAAILVRAASHPRPAIRAAALTAAGSIGGARMRRLVLNSRQMAAAEDEQWLVRSSAVLALARLGKAEDLALIQRAFQEGGGKAHWMARAAVARAIASLHPHPRAALERMLLDSDPRVAVTAATGLARAGYTPLIREYLRHPKASVRMATVSAVRSVKLLDTRPRLHHMARFDASREVRFAAAVTLFQWGDPAADEMMLDAVRANDPAIWAEAVAQLARRTGARHGRKVKAWRRTLAQQRATGGAR
ncbi:MAG: HEAT repeat domain-containing protein, partial [Planctomycetota bacterium]|nr:HEAT repeat domain-containing protein [Planctomycetota bacterium]